MTGIYAIQNCINGKIYIGQSINIERRWQQEKKLKRLNEHLLRAMKKYSIKNFSFYIIEECSKENLNKREAFYIKLYHSLNPEFGYNKTSGGDSLFKRHYQKLSEEHKKRISEANKKYHPSKASIEKSKITRKKNILKKHKVDIWCLETNKIYHSIEEVNEKLGIKKRTNF
jgi:group I intron endonuclease